jgi:hypothetical protein
MLFLGGCSQIPAVSGPGSSAPLPDLGKAPELAAEIWINVDAPLSMENLRGKVVLLDMWTYG